MMKMKKKIEERKKKEKINNKLFDFIYKKT